MQRFKDFLSYIAVLYICSCILQNTEGCEQVVDIGIIIDGSDGVNITEWRHLRELSIKYLEAKNASPIAYVEGVLFSIGRRIKSTGKVDSDLSYVSQRAMDWTDPALDSNFFMHTVLLAAGNAMVDQSSHPRKLIVMASKATSYPQYTKEGAQKLKDLGVTIYGIALKGADTAELTDMAGSSDRVYNMEDPLAESSLPFIDFDLCGVTEFPSTTDPPTTDTVTTDPPTTDPPTTDTVTTNPPTTDPPTTDPPTTEAPTTDSPTTKAPTTDPPTTEIPTTDPPTTDPSTTDPPTTDPPTTDPPTTDPPTTDPPTTDRPTTNPPTTDPPTTDLPTTDPPTTDPPTTDSPTTGPSTTERPTTGLPTTDPLTTNPPTTDPKTTYPPTTNPPTSKVSTSEVLATHSATTQALNTESHTSKEPTVTISNTEASTTEVQDLNLTTTDDRVTNRQTTAEQAETNQSTAYFTTDDDITEIKTTPTKPSVSQREEPAFDQVIAECLDEMIVSSNERYITNACVPTEWMMICGLSVLMFKDETGQVDQFINEQKHCSINSASISREVQRWNTNHDGTNVTKWMNRTTDTFDSSHRRDLQNQVEISWDNDQKRNPTDFSCPYILDLASSYEGVMATITGSPTGSEEPVKKVLKKYGVQCAWEVENIADSSPLIEVQSCVLFSLCFFVRVVQWL